MRRRRYQRTQAAKPKRLDNQLKALGLIRSTEIVLPVPRAGRRWIREGVYEKPGTEIP